MRTRTALDGRVNTVHADLKLNTRLMPKLNLTTTYRYNDRDNKTPQAQYWTIAGDSLGQTAGGISRIRTNLPVSITKQEIGADLDYQYAPETKLKFSYDYEWSEKTFQVIEETREHTAKAEVHRHFNDMISGGVDSAGIPLGQRADAVALLPGAAQTRQVGARRWCRAGGTVTPVIGAAVISAIEGLGQPACTVDAGMTQIAGDVQPNMRIEVAAPRDEKSILDVSPHATSGLVHKNDPDLVAEDGRGGWPRARELV